MNDGGPGTGLGHSREILSVGELTHRVKRELEGMFGAVWLTGEVSNLRAPASGHIYLTLKDTEAQVRAVIWGSTARYLKSRPRDGDQILCRGRLTVYEPRGEYQVVIDYLEAAGTGALFRQYEETRARLSAEGLFDKDLKRELPPLPRRVAVITSPTGAAVQDVLNVLGRRAPGLDVLVIPAAVQGDGAVRELLRAIHQLDDLEDVDAVILCRGGGSIEDLMAFNSEELARAIAATPMPVVVGVGHETDTTIADFVADLRAPTPSAAAELVSAAWGDTARRATELTARLQRAVTTRLAAEALRVRAARAGLVDPRDRLQHLIQRVDDLNGHMVQRLNARLAESAHRLQSATIKLFGAAPDGQIRQQTERTHALTGRLRQAMRLQLEWSGARLAETAGRLQELSPLGVLERGYAITRHQGKVVRRATDVEVDDTVQVRLHRGTLACRVVSRTDTETP